MVLICLPCLKSMALSLYEFKKLMLLPWYMSKQITVEWCSCWCFFLWPSLAVCGRAPALCRDGCAEPLEQISCLRSVWLPQESQPPRPTQTPAAQMPRHYCAVKVSHGVTQTNTDSHHVTAAVKRGQFVLSAVGWVARGPIYRRTDWFI